MSQLIKCSGIKCNGLPCKAFAMRNMTMCVAHKMQEPPTILEEIAAKFPQDILDIIYVKYLKESCNYEAMKKAHTILDKMVETCNSLSKTKVFERKKVTVYNTLIFEVNAHQMQGDAHCALYHITPRYKCVCAFHIKDKYVFLNFDEPKSFEEKLGIAAIALMASRKYGMFDKQKALYTRLQIQKQILEKL